MNAYERAMQVLERMNDPELLDAYKKYVARLEQILTPEEMDMYTQSVASIHVQTHAQPVEGHTTRPIGDEPELAPDDLEAPQQAEEDLEPTVEQQAVADKVAQDQEAQSLYANYVALLGNRQVLDDTFDPTSGQL